MGFDFLFEIKLIYPVSKNDIPDSYFALFLKPENFRLNQQLFGEAENL
jgi:hypothetical protein